MHLLLLGQSMDFLGFSSFLRHQQVAYYNFVPNVRKGDNMLNSATMYLFYCRDVDERELQEYSSQVADWVVNAKEGDSTTVTISNGQWKDSIN